jgi:hypothetical protein
LDNSLCWSYVWAGAVVVDEVTGDLVSTFADRPWFRDDCPACVHRDRAPGVEAATGWWVDRRREVVTEQDGSAGALLGGIGYRRR